MAHALDEPEVEEADAAARPEQVVARMGVAIEQSVLLEAATAKTKHSFAGHVALGL